MPETIFREHISGTDLYREGRWHVVPNGYEVHSAMHHNKNADQSTFRAVARAYFDQFGTASFSLHCWNGDAVEFEFTKSGKIIKEKEMM